jgi:hypothetical protein
MNLAQLVDQETISAVTTMAMAIALVVSIGSLGMEITYVLRQNNG